MFCFRNGKSCFAIIGDIKNSKELKMRNEVQVRLKAVLDEINKKYANDITAKFLITLGDEFQGLLTDGKNVLQIIQEIKMRLYPVELRFGIGAGEITTEINTEMALGADGPGFYKARTALEILKNNSRKNKAVPADIRLETEDIDHTQILLINTVFELLKSIEQIWTDRQREIIFNMLEYQDGQKNVALRMGIAQSSVQKSLANGKYYTYENAIKNVECILGEIRL